MNAKSKDYFHNIEPSGVNSEDNRTGRDLAKKLIEDMRDREAPFLLGHTVKAMIERGRYGAIEIGFFQQISEIALRK